MQNAVGQKSQGRNKQTDAEKKVREIFAITDKSLICK